MPRRVGAAGGRGWFAVGGRSEPRVMPSLVVAIGPLPPPTHGFSENTKIITDRLRGRCRLRVVDTSPGSPQRSPLYYISRIWREVPGGWELLPALPPPYPPTHPPPPAAA